MTSRDDAIGAFLLEMCRERGPEKSICPSEVARKLDPEHWRSIMNDVRRIAGELVKRGLIEATQAGNVIDLAQAKGPIRLRLSATSRCV